MKIQFTFCGFSLNFLYSKFIHMWIASINQSTHFSCSKYEKENEKTHFRVGKMVT